MKSYLLVASAALATTIPVAVRAQDPITGPLVVSTAGSMGPAFKQMLDAFVKLHPGVVPTLTTGGSVTGARQVADSAPAPDVFVSADDTLIDALLVPRHATWHARFASSPMVLAYGAQSHYASDITAQNWPQILMRIGVRAVRGDPDNDPGAYRTLMIFDLTAQAAHSTTLANDLTYAVHVADMSGTTLAAAFDSGSVDYMFMYRASAIAHHLKWVDLPPEVNLGDRARAAHYAETQVRIPSQVPGVADTITIRGAPVVYGLTVPTAAPHQKTALAFAAFALGSSGRAALRAAQFDVPNHPDWRGNVPPEVKP